MVGSLVLLGFGLWWLGLAILTTLRHAKTGIPFNLGWWGLTFPLGVFILALFNLGHQVEVVFYSMLQWHLVLLLVMWSVVMKKTLAEPIGATVLLSMFNRLTTKNKQNSEKVQKSFCTCYTFF